MNQKSRLRSEILFRRKLIPMSLVEQRSLMIFEQFKLLFQQFKHFKKFHCFLPIKKNKEVDTFPIVNYLSGQQKNIMTSIVTLEPRSMKHVYLDNQIDLKISGMGIPEPLDGEPADILSANAIIVPLVAADRNGGRIGYGKGFYDELLINVKKQVLKIGLSLTPCLDQIPQLESHDQKLDYCITPHSTVIC